MLACKGLDTARVLFYNTEVKHNGTKLIFLLGEHLIQLKPIHEQKAVLAPADADTNPVAILYQSVFFIGSPNAAKNLFHLSCPFFIDF